MNFSFVFLVFATAFAFVYCNHVRSKRDVNFTNVVTVDCSRDYRKAHVSALRNVSCQPYYRHVDLNLRPEQQLSPPSVFVRRCYGSTVDAGIVCVPKSNGTQIIRVPVSVWSSSPQQNQCSVVEVEEHLSCELKCKQGPESCSAEQEYIQSRCQCTCIAKNKDCPTGLTWDNAHCGCARV